MHRKNGFTEFFQGSQKETTANGLDIGRQIVVLQSDDPESIERGARMPHYRKIFSPRPPIAIRDCHSSRAGEATPISSEIVFIPVDSASRGGSKRNSDQSLGGPERVGSTMK